MINLLKSGFILFYRFFRVIKRKVTLLPLSPCIVKFLSRLFLGSVYDSKLSCVGDVKRIAVIRTDQIGDTVMTVPLLRSIRKIFPEAVITLIVKPELRELFEICPYVDEVLSFDWQFGGLLAGWIKNYVCLYRAVRFSRKLRDKGFDIAIVPRWDVDFYFASIIAYLSGARCRIGYSEKVSDMKRIYNKGFDAYFNYILYDTELKHEVKRNMNILRVFNCKEEYDDSLELWTDCKDEETADRIIDSFFMSKPEWLICIAPVAGEENRLWPMERYIEVIKYLFNRYSAAVIILGGKKDESKLERFTGIENLLNLAGKLTLRQTLAIIKRSRFLIANDTGVVHMASAVNVPSVVISPHPLTADPAHHNSPVRFSPWKVKSVVVRPFSPRPPCIDGCMMREPHCILNIDVERVIKGIEKLLSEI